MPTMGQLSTIAPVDATGAALPNPNRPPSDVIGSHDKYESYESWVDRYPAVDPGAKATGQDVAFQLYSSGTTGRPKEVMLTSSASAGNIGRSSNVRHRSTSSSRCRATRAERS
jgi:acyl-CoA synthetase (AMP-forming)/AMP-acid ligase II